MFILPCTRAPYWLAALVLMFIVSTDDSTGSGKNAVKAQRRIQARNACEGGRPPLPDMLAYNLQSGAFPGSRHPDVAVHVPAGFDATRRPGLIVYFHGWQGCVAASLASGDVPCADGGPPAPASNLIAAVDAAGVNALLVAVELRVNMPTGEPGQLSMASGLHDLLRELLSEKLAGALGCPLPVDRLDPVVIVAHSGGYQAAASVLSRGDVPQIREVVLLDALYGSEEAFRRFVVDDIDGFDPRRSGGLRFVDLYTCCGGTLDASRSLSRLFEGSLARAGLGRALFVDDGDREPDAAVLAHRVVFKRVPRAHGELPRAYARSLLEAAGFEPISTR